MGNENSVEQPTTPPAKAPRTVGRRPSATAGDLQKEPSGHTAVAQTARRNSLVLATESFNQARENGEISPQDYDAAFGSFRFGEARTPSDWTPNFTPRSNNLSPGAGSRTPSRTPSQEPTPKARLGRRRSSNLETPAVLDFSKDRRSTSRSNDRRRGSANSSFTFGSNEKVVGTTRSNRGSRDNEDEPDPRPPSTGSQAPFRQTVTMFPDIVASPPKTTDAQRRRRSSIGDALRLLASDDTNTARRSQDSEGAGGQEHDTLATHLDRTANTLDVTLPGHKRSGSRAGSRASRRSSVASFGGDAGGPSFIGSEENALIQKRDKIPDGLELSNPYLNIREEGPLSYSNEKINVVDASVALTDGCENIRRIANAIDAKVKKKQNDGVTHQQLESLEIQLVSEKRTFENQVIKLGRSLCVKGQVATTQLFEFFEYLLASDESAPNVSLLHVLLSRLNFTMRIGDVIFSRGWIPLAARRSKPKFLAALLRIPGVAQRARKYQEGKLVTDILQQSIRSKTMQVALISTLLSFSDELDLASFRDNLEGLWQSAFEAVCAKGEIISKQKTEMSAEERKAENDRLRDELEVLRELGGDTVSAVGKLHRGKSHQDLTGRVGLLVKMLSMPNVMRIRADKQGRDGYTILARACRDDDQELVSLFVWLKLGDVNKVCKAKVSPLIAAIQAKNIQCVGRLLDHPAIDLEMAVEGGTAMEHAERVKSTHPQIHQLLTSAMAKLDESLGRNPNAAAAEPSSAIPHPPDQKKRRRSSVGTNLAAVSSSGTFGGGGSSSLPPIQGAEKRQSQDPDTDDTRPTRSTLAPRVPLRGPLALLEGNDEQSPDATNRGTGNLRLRRRASSVSHIIPAITFHHEFMERVQPLLKVWRANTDVANEADMEKGTLLTEAVAVTDSLAEKAKANLSKEKKTFAQGLLNGDEKLSIRAEMVPILKELLGRLFEEGEDVKGNVELFRGLCFRFDPSAIEHELQSPKAKSASSKKTDKSSSSSGKKGAQSKTTAEDDGDDGKPPGYLLYVAQKGMHQFLATLAAVHQPIDEDNALLVANACVTHETKRLELTKAILKHGRSLLMPYHSVLWPLWQEFFTIISLGKTSKESESVDDRLELLRVMVTQPEVGINFEKESSQDGHTILSRAAFEGDIHTIQFLFDEKLINDSHINHVLSDGSTLLIQAVCGNRVSVVEYLSKHKATNVAHPMIPPAAINAFKASIRKCKSVEEKAKVKHPVGMTAYEIALKLKRDRRIIGFLRQAMEKWNREHGSPRATTEETAQRHQTQRQQLSEGGGVDQSKKKQHQAQGDAVFEGLRRISQAEREGGGKAHEISPEDSKKQQARRR